MAETLHIYSHMITGILLDIDGTVLDSNDAHAESWVKALREFDFQADFRQIRNLIGKGGDKLLPEVTGLESDSQRGKEISKRCGEIFKSEYLKTLRPFPGARKFIEGLIKHGIKICVATSAGRDELHLLLKRTGIDDLISNTVTSDDVKNSKPSADIIVVALKKIDLKSDQVLMVGDTPYDIEAAQKANVKTVAFRCGGWSDQALNGAVAIYDGPADFSFTILQENP